MTPDQIASLFLRSYAHGEQAWSEASISDYLAKSSTVAVEGSDAFALAQVIANEAELLAVAVHPGQQNKGVGRKLVSDLMDACRDRGATEAFLEVSERNLPARKLYEVLGFHAAGRRRAYYRSGRNEPTDAIVYRKTL